MAKDANNSTLESKTVAVREEDTKGVMIGGAKYAVVRAVNVPTLKQETNETVAVKIVQPLETKVNYTDEEAVIDGVKRTVKKETIITIARVLELNSGQEFEYVCNAMTADNLRSTYPNDDYVGRCFGIQKLGVVAGKRYKETKIWELQPVA